MNLFKKYKITTLINLSILNIDKSIDDAILEKIKDKYEQKITKFGYIKQDSIEIIKRSYGIAMKEHFNSCFNYKAICYASICNPSIDQILFGKIVSNNNAGFKAEITDNGNVIIEAIIPRLTAGIKHEYDIENIKNDDEVYLKVCRKRLHFNDNKITIIGMIINNPNKEELIEGGDGIVEDLVKISNTDEYDNDNDNDNDIDNDNDNDIEEEREYDDEAIIDLTGLNDEDMEDVEDMEEEDDINDEDTNHDKYDDEYEDDYI
jgi:DNA-directed RNA polymerase subunit E'/Rpb7